MRGLLTDAELFDDSTVSFNIVLLKISQQVSSVADHFEKAAVGMAVFRISLEVDIELIDTVGEKRYLNLRGTGIALVNGIIGNDLLL